MRISTPSTAMGILRRMEGVPNLAGGPDALSEHKLVYFRGETRKDEKMTPVTADLTDDDIRGLGAFFASLAGPPAPTEADLDLALTKAGAAVVEDRRCAKCHPDVCRSGRNSAIGWAASGNDRKSVARLSARCAPRARRRHHAGEPIRWTRTTSRRSRISCRARARTQNRERSAVAPRAAGSVSRGPNA